MVPTQYLEIPPVMYVPNINQLLIETQLVMHFLSIFGA